MMSETKKLHSFFMEGVGTSTVDWYSQYTSYPSSNKKKYTSYPVQCSAVYLKGYMEPRREQF